MSRVIPILIAVVVIAALTVVEGRMSERWGDNRLCAYCATLLDDVPARVDDWVGSDGDVEQLVQETAGARGFVSRSYRNEATGQQVGVWLIVGHARDTARHTPDVCYASSGFEYDDTSKHVLRLEGDKKASFLTAVFTKSVGVGGELKERVYWTWFKPQGESGEPVEWRAPDNVRMEIGAAPALYKLYFSTSGQAALAEHDQSVCMEFAKEFLPAIAPVLAPANESIPDGFNASAVEGVTDDPSDEA